jgi:hypothetical protein
MRMRMDSTVREATYPRAMLSLIRLRMGKMTTRGGDAVIASA